MLWGIFAKKKGSRVDTSRHTVIKNAHPSWYSRMAWSGCKCFSKCNTALHSLGHAPIKWSLPA